MVFSDFDLHPSPAHGDTWCSHTQTNLHRFYFYLPIRIFDIEYGVLSISQLERVTHFTGFIVIIQ